VRTGNQTKHALLSGRHAMAGAVSTLTMALALTGCAVGPKFVRPQAPVNPAWNEKDDVKLSTQAGADTAWWTAFNDTTLDRLVRNAYHQNLSLQIAGLRIMQARAQLGIAVGRQYPQVQAMIGKATAVGLNDHAAAFAGVDGDFWDYEVGFDVQWELDFWHKYGSGVRAETAQYLASVADYDNALVSLTAEVARTYTLIRTYEVLIEQARRNVQVQEDGLRIATSRFRNGATSELDVSQATTLLENTRASIPTLQISLDQARNALGTLLGLTAGAIQLGAPGDIPGTTAPVAVSVPADMLRRRPDIRGAELAAMAQCARIGVAKADLYPSFTLVGKFSTQSISGAGLQLPGVEIPKLFGPGSLFYSFGPQLFWPLFNYGRIQNNIRLQDAGFQQQLVGYRSTVLKAAQEVEDGMTGYLRAQEATAFAQNAARSAQRSVDLAFIQYREGAVDFQRVLDAQRSLLQEENNLARTRSSVATYLISLYKALGGGWQMRQGQPFVEPSTQAEMQKRTNWGNLFSTQPSPPTSTGSSPNR
jgi:NodT family efflux transporter outer membrane factor (OMF) lipoprotein